MSLLLMLLFVASIGCDVAGQIFFKLGADRVPDVSQGSAGSFAHTLLTNRFLQAGLAIYAVEMVIWLRILSEVPISIAFPIASLNFLGVALASWWLLGERLGDMQWAGAGLVTIGVALVAGTV